MNTVVCIITLFICGCCSMTVRELDEIFEDAECIEGEFLLVNVAGDVSGGNVHKVILIKNHDIKLAAQSTPTSTLLAEVKESAEANKNALNLINELAQFNKIAIEFVLLAELGEPHARTFRVRLNLGEEAYDAGAKSVRDAKRRAAMDALATTNYAHPPVKTREQLARDIEQLTPTVHLNNIAAKLGIKVEYFNDAGAVIADRSDDYLYYSLDSSTRGYMELVNGSTTRNLKTPSVENEVHRGPFHVRVDVAGESFVGTGRTIQAARHDAAERALDKFKRMSMEEADECIKGGYLCNKLNLKSSISLVHETAQSNGWSVAFDVVDEYGPSHKKVFAVLCKVGDLRAQAEGASKKEAKRKAAELMLKQLDGVQPWQLINAKNDDSGMKKKKKKKKKQITRPDVLQQAAISVLDAFSSISGKSEKSGGGGGMVEATGDDKGPKGELLDMGKEIGIDVKFASFADKQSEAYGSLVTLDTDPSAVHCYSKDVSPERAEDNAALHALRFLKHVGLNNILVPLKNHDGKKIILLDDTKRQQPTTKI